MRFSSFLEKYAGIWKIPLQNAAAGLTENKYHEQVVWTGN